MPQGAFRSRWPWSVNPKRFPAFQHCVNDLQEGVSGRHVPLAHPPTAADPFGHSSHRSPRYAPPVRPCRLDQEPAQEGHAVSLQVAVEFGLPGLMRCRCEPDVRTHLLDAGEPLDRAEVGRQGQRGQLADPRNRVEELSLRGGFPFLVNPLVEGPAGRLDRGECVGAPIDLLDVELP